MLALCPAVCRRISARNGLARNINWLPYLRRRHFWYMLESDAFAGPGGSGLCYSFLENQALIVNDDVYARKHHRRNRLKIIFHRRPAYQCREPVDVN